MCECCFLSSFQPYMADRFFAMFDAKGVGSVDRDLLLDGLADLTGGSAIHKLEVLFYMLDDQR